MQDQTEREKPLGFNERNQLILPSASNPLQHQFEELKVFADKKLLKIKEKKTNVMKFNFSRHYDFPPELTIGGFSNQLPQSRKQNYLGLSSLITLNGQPTLNIFVAEPIRECGPCAE